MDVSRFHLLNFFSFICSGRILLDDYLSRGLHWGLELTKASPAIDGMIQWSVIGVYIYGSVGHVGVIAHWSDLGNDLLGLSLNGLRQRHIILPLILEPRIICPRHIPLK